MGIITPGGGGGSSTLTKYSAALASNTTVPAGGSIAIITIPAVPAGVYLVSGQVTLSGATSTGNCDIIVSAPGLGSGCGSSSVVTSQETQIELSEIVTTTSTGSFSLSVLLAAGVTGTVQAIAAGPVSLNSQLCSLNLVKIG